MSKFKVGQLVRLKHINVNAVLDDMHVRVYVIGGYGQETRHLHWDWMPINSIGIIVGEFDKNSFDVLINEKLINISYMYLEPL
jgi:hypothetical protein